MSQGFEHVFTLWSGIRRDSETQALLHDVDELMRLVQGKPGTFFISELSVTGGPPTIQVDPRSAANFEREMQQFETDTGFSFRDGMLGTIDDSWRVIAQPTPNGLVTGWTIAIDLRDGAQLKTAQDTILKLMEDMFQRGDGPTLISEQVADHTVHTVEINEVGVPFSPSWCVTDHELLVTLTPMNLKRLLTELRNKPSRAELPIVRSQLAGDARTLAIAHIDTKEVVRALFPLLKMAMEAMANRPGAPAMPPNFEAVAWVNAVVPHLQPTRAGPFRLAAAQTKMGSRF